MLQSVIAEHPLPFGKLQLLEPILIERMFPYFLNAFHYFTIERKVC